MWRIAFLFCPGLLAAEVRIMTLAEAVATAVKQNADVVMARLDEAQAAQAVAIARDPFSPRIGVGSGLAYSSGFPMSIEGASPSIFQARARQYLFNRQQSYLVAHARENVRGAGIARAITAEDVAFRTTGLYLDVERANRMVELTECQVTSLTKVTETVSGQVAEGRELPVVLKRAQLNMQRARQLAQAVDGDREMLERSLAVILGFSAEDRVRPAATERATPPVPPTVEEAVRQALDTSRQMRRLQSAIAAKELEIQGFRAARLPRVDLVAQYGLFARFNNYEDYFQRFERNNAQIGVSFELPLLPGPAIGAQTAQGRAAIRQLQTQIDAVRNRVALDTRAAYREVQDAGVAREVARLDLEVARDTLSVALAQMEEGRAPKSQVEETRFREDEKWIALYDSQYALEKARWNLARLTGDLAVTLAALAAP
jgi:outer membrane protein TolC